jgi:HlyD family secretion protein
MTPNADSISQTLRLSTPPASGWKKIIWFLLLITLILGALWWWKQSGSGEKTRYLTAPIERKALTTSVSATGNLEPTNTIDVGIEVSGTISEVFVDYNDRVEAGELLARLDTTRLASRVTSSKAALLRMQANISAAKASLANAQNEYDRVHKMYASTQGNYPSKKEVDEAGNALLSAKASLDAAIAQAAQSRAELESDEDNLRKAIIVAPDEGIILERKIEPGQTVVASMQTPVLFKMAKSLETMKVIVSVDEADIGEVKESQKVTFNVDAYPNELFSGTITQLRLNSQIINGVVTYDAVVEVPNPALKLRPGMTATAQIITGVIPSALTVPNAALRFTPPQSKKEKKTKSSERINHHGASVWVLRNNLPLQITVERGKSDGVSTAITSPELTDHDRVIIGVEGESRE